HGHVDADFAELECDRGHAVLPRLAAQRHDAVEPGAAVEDAGHVGPHDGDQARAAVVLAERADGRRRHDRVADPVGQEDGDVHEKSAPLRVAANLDGYAAPSRCSVRVVECPSRIMARWTRPPYVSTKSAPTTS